MTATYLIDNPVQGKEDVSRGCFIACTNSGFLESAILREFCDKIFFVGLGEALNLWVIPCHLLQLCEGLPLPDWQVCRSLIFKLCQIAMKAV
jgi:hypothetical protein